MINSSAVLQKAEQYGRSTFGFISSLFSSRMTPFTFFLDFYAYPVFITLALGFGAWGNRHGIWWHGLAMLVFGYAVWTLVEYVMHRYAFHHMPGVKPLHMAHHADAGDLIGAPTIYSFGLIFTFAYLPMAWFVGVYLACFWFAGMMAGYLAFCGLHYVVHNYSDVRFVTIRKLKRGHAIHHYGDNSHNFGVTTLFWDRVFGTYSDRMR